MKIGIIKNFGLNLKDEIRIFRKYIKDGRIHLNEEIDFNEKIPEKFINTCNADYTLHYFDGHKTKNYIFYNPTNKRFPLNFVDLILLLIVHGNKDNLIISFEKKINLLKFRPLTLTCGKSSTFMNELLKTIAVESRLILTLTWNNWNRYDNGHTMLEIYSKNLNKWILYDVDLKNVFMKKNRLLNLKELINSNYFDVVPTSNQPFLNYSGNEKYFLISEYANYNQYDWYKKVFQLFSIFDTTTNQFVFKINNSSDEKKIYDYFGDTCICAKDKLFYKTFYN